MHSKKYAFCRNFGGEKASVLVGQRPFQNVLWQLFVFHKEGLRANAEWKPVGGPERFQGRQKYRGGDHFEGYR